MTSTHAQAEVRRKQNFNTEYWSWYTYGRVVVNYPQSGREGDHKKNTSQKKAPLSLQVHAADIPQDSRTHMDKKAKIS